MWHSDRMTGKQEVTGLLPVCRPSRQNPRGQLTAFFTSAPILVSSAAVNSFSAKAVGHMWPSSRFALSLKPSVAYLVLNFCALWKKQMTWSSLAYAGIPYQVFGERVGALALMIAWSRSPIARSGAGIAAIFASTALSPSALPALGPAFSSWTRSLIAARSSSVNPSTSFLPVTVVLLAAFRVLFFAGFLSAMVSLRRIKIHFERITRNPEVTRLRKGCPPHIRYARLGRMSHPDLHGPPDRTPIRVGEVWENPITGERATILERPWDNPAGRATAELTALVGARVVGEHRHPALVEQFTVLEGELTVKRDGQTSILDQGETAVIKPGV